MTELPPDPARLRQIQAHLERQVADNETVTTYLRLQLNAVRQALAAAEAEQPATRAPAPPAKPRLSQIPQFTRPDATGFKIVERTVPGGAVLVALHVGDCDVDEGPEQRVNAHDAAVALRDGLAACVFCRPDTELGIPG